MTPILAQLPPNISPNCFFPRSLLWLVLALSQTHIALTCPPRTSWNPILLWTEWWVGLWGVCYWTWLSSSMCIVLWYSKHPQHKHGQNSQQRDKAGKIHLKGGWQRRHRSPRPHAHSSKTKEPLIWDEKERRLRNEIRNKRHCNTKSA